MFLAVLALVLPRICPTVFADDSPETVAACLTLGVTHPPGDPLLVLAGRAWLALVPAGNTAWRVNLLAAALVAGAAVMVWRLAVAGIAGAPARLAGAAAAGALVLANPVLLQQASVAKGVTYGLNLLLLLCAARAVLARKVAAAGLFAGLLAAHHWMTLAAFVPALVAIAALILRRRPDRPSPRGLLLLACAFVLGASLWTVLPLRAGGSPRHDWGDVSSARRFAAHLARKPFLEREARPTPGSVARQVAGGAAEIHRQVGWAGWILAAAGMWMLRESSRFAALSVTAAALSPWLAACAYLDLPAHLIRLLGVFLLPTSLALTALGARGAAQIAGRHGRGGAAVVAALLAAGLILQWPQVRTYGAGRFTWSHDLARAMLAPLPHGALLLVSGDLDTLPLWHAQTVESYRTDVRVVNRVLLNHSWYRKQNGITGISASGSAAGAESVRRLLERSGARAFSSPERFPELDRAAVIPYHLTLAILPAGTRGTPARPRGFSFRGALERLRHLPEPHSQLVVGYTMEAMRNLAQAGPPGP